MAKKNGSDFLGTALTGAGVIASRVNPFFGGFVALVGSGIKSIFGSDSVFSDNDDDEKIEDERRGQMPRSGQSRLPSIGDSIPEHYGRVKFPPKYFQKPFLSIEGDKIYFNQLFTIGYGYYSRPTIVLGGGLFEYQHGSEIAVQLIDPNSSLTLFSGNFYVEDSGEGLNPSSTSDPDQNSWSQYYIFNTEKYDLTNLSIIFQYPNGLNNGSSGGFQVTYTVETSIISFDGDVRVVKTGVSTHSVSDSENTKLNIYREHTISLASVSGNRIGVRVRRETAEAEGEGHSDRSVILQMKVGYRHPIFGDGNAQSGNFSMYAVKSLLTGNVTTSLLNNLELIVHRVFFARLNGAFETDYTFTSNAVSCTLDLLRRYVRDEDIDFTSFDYLIGKTSFSGGDETSTCLTLPNKSLEDACNEMLRQVQANLTYKDGMIGVVSHLYLREPKMLLTEKDMKNLSISFRFRAKNEENGVRVFYKDFYTFEKKEIKKGTEPYRDFYYSGIRSVVQADIVCSHIHHDNINNRKTISFDMGLDGHVLSYLDTVLICHHLINTSHQSFKILGYDSSDNFILDRNINLMEDRGKIYYAHIKSMDGDILFTSEVTQRVGDDGSDKVSLVFVYSISENQSFDPPVHEVSHSVTEFTNPVKMYFDQNKPAFTMSIFEENNDPVKAKITSIEQSSYESRRITCEII